MKLTAIQEKYYAWDISHKKSVSDDSRYTGVLSEARVDLNPHQVDAALFAFKSPLSKGAILADEVGLGKTIEAGIILSQFWAEHKRRILIILPASLRAQWNIELMEKFYLPSAILVSDMYEAMRKAGQKPFEQDAIILCSYQFAAKHDKEINHVHWDLVVIDEAHKMRNVLKKTSKISNLIKASILPFKKILMTATPLQNNLNELNGLISVIDQNFFANRESFSENYNAVTTRDNARYGALKLRLQTIVQRTLRRQVQEYVKYTRRSAMVEEFVFSEAEQMLYDGMNDYLNQPFTIGISDEVKPLLTLVIRKIMASSAYALSFTLSRMIDRLQRCKEFGTVTNNILSILQDEDEISSELEEDEINMPLSDLPDCSDLQDEIDQLTRLRDLAQSISNESKAVKLLTSLRIGFQKMKELGAFRKALIFTESRRTQSYLNDFLEKNGYAGKVVCFNGTNNSVTAKGIYNKWLQQNFGTDRVCGDLAIDRKQALVDYFRDYAEIMIATEAGAEGINLQFCSMVVNYDMPWNPQRIEQRIGRCHRYGQKHDVVVVNFVNQKNAADKRVYEILNTKFKLFEGVFGCSDEILGALDSGLDFEKRLGAIFQTCRTEDDINTAFDTLQKELEDIISERINNTKMALLEHFDEDVIKKLKSRQEVDSLRIDQYGRHLWKLACSVLDGHISDIDEQTMSFVLQDGIAGLTPGVYSLMHNNLSHHLRTGSDIGRYIIFSATQQEPTPVEITFDLTRYKYRSASLEHFKGQSGYCMGQLVKSECLKDQEEVMLMCGISDTHEPVEDDFGCKLLELDALSERPALINNDARKNMERIFNHQLERYKESLSSRANDYLNQEIDKLYAWADDNLYPLEEEVGQIRKQLEANRRQSKKSKNTTERIALKKEEMELRKQLTRKQALCDEKREYYNKESDRQIDEMEKALSNTVDVMPFFVFRWKLV